MKDNRFAQVSNAEFERPCRRTAADPDAFNHADIEPCGVKVEPRMSPI
jgi:hypothetical protein